MPLHNEIEDELFEWLMFVNGPPVAIINQTKLLSSFYPSIYKFRNANV